MAPDLPAASANAALPRLGCHRWVSKGAEHCRGFRWTPRLAEEDAWLKLGWPPSSNVPLGKLAVTLRPEMGMSTLSLKDY